MSRIQFETNVHGKVFPIAIGWDRRLGQCFVSVSDENMGDEEYEDERFDAILEASSAGLRQRMCVDDCKAILDKARVSIPGNALDVLREHVRANAGNVIVQFDAGGVATVVLDQDKREAA